VLAVSLYAKKRHTIMAVWNPRLQNDVKLKYLGIVAALEADIFAEVILPGDRLPAQRKVAELLDVDLTTVTRAFNEARRRGLIEGNKGRGTFIRSAVESKLLSEKQVLLDLSMNNPPQPAKANLQQRIPEGINRLIADARRMSQLQYQDSAGNADDREAALGWLKQKVPTVRAEQVVISAGAQSALYAICRSLLKVDDKLAAPAYTYPGLKAVVAQIGAELVAIEMDEQGICPKSFEQCCQQQGIKALYLVPTIDNPTTTTLPHSRRVEIITIAQRYQVAIIEDDPYSSLQEKSLATFAELAPEITWYIATLSKSATPALRVAFVLAPTGAHQQQIATVLRATSLMAPPLMSALVSRWIYDGTLREVATAIRQENRVRQAIASKLLSEFSFSSNKDGHHLWLQLPSYWSADEFAQQASRLGVAIVPSSEFAVTSSPIDAVRVSLGVAADSEALTKALKILVTLLKQAPNKNHRTALAQHD